MPHPDNLVDITVDADVGASPRDQFSTICVIGTANGSVGGTGSFNDVTQHASASSVADAYGDGSDVHNEAKEAFAEGINSIWAIVLEATNSTEVAGDSNNSALQEASVSTVPISGSSPVAVTVDSTAMSTVNAVTESPPTVPSDADTANYNPDTGEIAVGTASSGSGNGIEVTFDSLSWTEGLNQLAGIGVDLAAMAEYRVGPAQIGDMDELLTWADGEDCAVPVVYTNGQSFSAPEDGMNEAHEVGAYLTSKFGLPVANESTDNVAGRILGRYGVEEAWYDIFLKTLPLNVPIPSRYEPLIGSPEQQGTFEGGSASGGGGSDSGPGAANVLIDDGGTVLSNSLSLAGLESDYRYLDVARTEAYVKDRIRVAISDAFRDNDVRFNETGRTQILAAIDEELGPITGSVNQPLRDFEAFVPEPTDIPEQSRKNRIWSGITVEITIAGYAHRADVTLVIEV